VLLSDAGVLVASAPEFILMVRSWHQYLPRLAGFSLQFEERSSLLVASWGFSVPLPFWSGKLLVQGSSPGVVVTKGVSDFSLRKDAHITDLVLLMLVVTTLVSE